MTRPWHRFRFRSSWRRLPAPPARIYAELQRVEDYPVWWPQTRAASPAVAVRNRETAEIRLRSFLPLEHRVTLRAERREPHPPGPDGGDLAVAMDGDMRGWVRCTVRADSGGGSRVDFEQYTEVATPLLRLVALPARPLLRANHAWMMRAGRRGLTARLRGLDEG
ncbi:polyketide cyclase [Streptomyces sp. RKND-216]|uniref:polyketide cyclase n=1 Tax=Streptomyces sp. RKND-216 TaxID=2562581 RepID=UPI00109DF6E9|nr:polyketide cyclase [Streptomyces sp. RKND-216]THA27309.1 polyketide cyclase [Streptomyces sp. RKND-216]